MRKLIELKEKERDLQVTIDEEKNKVVQMLKDIFKENLKLDFSISFGVDKRLGYPKDIVSGLSVELHFEDAVISSKFISNCELKNLLKLED